MSPRLNEIMSEKETKTEPKPTKRCPKSWCRVPPMHSEKGPSSTDKTYGYRILRGVPGLPLAVVPKARTGRTLDEGRPARQ